MKSTRCFFIIVLMALAKIGLAQVREVSISYDGVHGYDSALGQVLEWSSLKEEPRVRSSDKPPEGLRLRWLGTSGFELGDNKTTILIDPFVSRPRVSNPLAPLIIDTTAVDELILKPMGDRNVDVILVSHAHADHVMDVPLVLSRSTTTNHRPLLVGDPNTVALVESYHLSAETRLLAFDEGVVHYLIGQFGDFTVEAVRSLHPQYDFLPWRGPEGEIEGHPPFTGFDYLSYRNIAIAYIISYRGLKFVFCDGAVLQNLQAIGEADLLVLGIPVRKNNTIADALAALQPSFFIPTHYDDFFVPFHEMDQFDVTIGLTVPLPGKNNDEILLVDFSRFGKFFEEFPNYIRGARRKLPTESQSFLDPRLRILKPLTYYSLESLILK